MDLVSLLVVLIIGGLAYWLVSMLPLPSPFPEVIRVVVIVALLIWLLRTFLGGRI